MPEAIFNLADGRQHACRWLRTYRGTLLLDTDAPRYGGAGSAPRGRAAAARPTGVLLRGAARMRSLARRARAPRGHLGRRGDQLRDLLRARHRAWISASSPVRDDARESRAGPTAGADGPDLARLPARRPPGPALRLPDGRALRAGARAIASIRPSSCSIPTPRRSSGTIRWSDALSGYSMRTPLETRDLVADELRQRGGHSQERGGGVGLQLGRRQAAADSVEPHGHLRSPRQGHDHAAPGGARGAPGHVPRPGAPSRSSTTCCRSASPRSSCCRCTTSSPSAAWPSWGWRTTGATPPSASSRPTCATPAAGWGSR